MLGRSLFPGYPDSWVRIIQELDFSENPSEGGNNTDPGLAAPAHSTVTSRFEPHDLPPEVLLLVPTKTTLLSSSRHLW